MNFTVFPGHLVSSYTGDYYKLKYYRVDYAVYESLSYTKKWLTVREKDFLVKRKNKRGVVVNCLAPIYNGGKIELYG